MKTEDAEKGMAWFNEHKDHVLKMVSKETHSYEPWDGPYYKGGDAHDPRLWKPAHWRWFLYTHTG